ncbi:hypothetical protein TNIN_8041 [Trichonephila inaurata madagascariensis]|uniref:Uncharacterized protein n=1 Tax=Trichonephila inaurata madagascariensis TaxID=2747483 RepID=A0A8X7CFU0_9ARAC|nr:hypothetical protein TNIN_8041 [Trichonephila inaurata madagascariensis]
MSRYRSHIIAVIYQFYRYGNLSFIVCSHHSIPFNQQYRTCISIIKVILYKCGLETAHFYSKVEKIITYECNFKAGILDIWDDHVQLPNAAQYNSL